jgi:hypothetical protein
MSRYTGLFRDLFGVITTHVDCSALACPDAVTGRPHATIVNLRSMAMNTSTTHHDVSKLLVNRLLLLSPYLWSSLT